MPVANVGHEAVDDERLEYRQSWSRIDSCDDVIRLGRRDSVKRAQI